MVEIPRGDRILIFINMRSISDEMKKKTKKMLYGAIIGGVLSFPLVIILQDIIGINIPLLTIPLIQYCSNIPSEICFYGQTVLGWAIIGAVLAYFLWD